MICIKRKGSRCKCPHCGFINKLEQIFPEDGKSKQCKHLYDVIDGRDSNYYKNIVYYYFINEEELLWANSFLGSESNILYWYKKQKALEEK